MTREQVLNANEFHFGNCKRITGPRGGMTFKIERWRRNGKNKLWKTRPNNFRIPIVTGFRGPYSYLTQEDLFTNCFHLPEDCPALYPIIKENI